MVVLLGMSADPARVLKGTRMGGRYGGKRITVRHLPVIRIDVREWFDSFEGFCTWS